MTDKPGGALIPPEYTEGILELLKMTDISCGNARHPQGAWYDATPLAASWEWAERFRQWVRRRLYGCGCKAKA